ncbi:MAG: iron ABC transporter permease [Candidatus Methanomethylophilaceae archaeon]|nr:iron ABC transporter permease [Candidatus Methanomethylophilaceae archaeon]
MSGDVPPEETYIRGRRIRYVLMMALILATAVLVVFSFGTGSGVISFDIAMDVIRERMNGNIPDRSKDYWAWLCDRLVYDGTIPRALGGVMVGAILGISGAVMQMCVRNPLASPYTTGISSAALFGVTIHLVLGISIIPLGNGMDMILNAFLFSMIPCMLMVFLSMKMKTTPSMLVLIGIGVMYIFNAITMMLKYGAEPEILKQIQMWSVGSISGITWNDLGYLLIATMILFVSMMALSGRMDALASGDRMSQSLGVEPVGTRLLCMVIISACTAVAVCFSGSIGFVGLVIPHISRMLVGSRSDMLLPCSAILGATLLIGADVLSRILSTGLPVGAVTAVIGAPVFLYFLVKMRTNGWGR